MLPSPLRPALLACLAVLPSVVRAQDLPATAESRAALASLADGMTLETLPGNFVLAAAPRAGTAAVDPHYNHSLDRAVVLYAVSAGRLERRVTVHHERADQDDALRAARLTAAVLALHSKRFSKPAKFPRDADSADLWLLREPAPDASVGGETRSNNVYVYGTATPRSDGEWIRTLCHELGHLILPAARGYVRPEVDAGGELGERLFQRWLAAETPPGIWSSAAVAGYLPSRVAPLIDRFRLRGPNDPAIGRRDADAMELYLGAALAFEDAFGSRLLGAALYGIDSEEPQELMDSMRRAVFGEVSVPVRLPAWVPFADDTYALSPIAGKGTLAIDKRPPLTPDPKRPLAILRPGWKYVRAAAGDLSAVRLTRKRP